MFLNNKEKQHYYTGISYNETYMIGFSYVPVATEIPLFLSTLDFPNTLADILLFVSPHILHITLNRFNRFILKSMVGFFFCFFLFIYFSWMRQREKA